MRVNRKIGPISVLLTGTKLEPRGITQNIQFSVGMLNKTNLAYPIIQFCLYCIFQSFGLYAYYSRDLVEIICTM